MRAMAGFASLKPATIKALGKFLWKPSVWIGAIALYLALGTGFWLGQTRLIFSPSVELDATPAVVQLAYEEVWLPVGTEQVHGWWVPAAIASAPTLLVLHGNSSNIGDFVNRVERFHQLGVSVFLIDYRGYGRSSPTFPSEQKVYADAEAAWSYLTQTRNIPPSEIFLYGHSLGGAIALYLADQHPEAAGIIVEATFTTMEAMVNDAVPFPLLPIDWLLHQRFDSLERVRSLQMPILILHGTGDRRVPVEMAHILYAAAPEPKTLVLIPDADHSNVPTVGGRVYRQAIGEFLR